VTARSHNFVVFSDDWGRHPSSCQHLFRRIARDHRVLWVNTIGLRAAKADSFTFRRGAEKLQEWTRPLKQVSDNMWVLAPIMLPVTAGPLGHLNSWCTVKTIRTTMRRLGITRPILWASVPTAADYIHKLDEGEIVYYVTDDYSLWPGSNAPRIRQADRRLTEAADLILPCTRVLAESHRTDRARTVILPHAVDFEHFARDRDPDEPADLARIAHPRACFFGLVYEKIDLSALADLARAREDLQIVLIGPVKTDVDSVAALPNVHFLGPRPYERLPAYLAAMDVLLVPYVLDDETMNKGPLKIRECLAAGKPTVARAIADLESFADVIGLYDSPEQLPGAVSDALRSAGPELTRRMRDHVRSDTWAARVEQIMEELSPLPAARGRLSSATAPCGSRDDRTCSAELTTDPPAWDEYLARNPEATIYHQPAWGRVMQQAYGNQPVYLTARREGQIAGVLQLVTQQSALFGSGACSLPYFDAAGVLADDDEARKALIDRARRMLRRRHADRVELRQLAKIDPALPCRTDKVTFLLNLPDDPELLWKDLKAKVRNQIRKARRADLTAEHGRGELLGEFHEIYARNMRDLGSPPHSRRFFRLIIEAFGPAARIFVVRRRRRPLAASLTLTDTHALRVPWAGSDWRQRNLNANMLLYWSMIEHGCRSGALAFDFGRSTRESGTYRFKKQWGARETDLYWQYILPAGGRLPQLRHDSPKYKLVIACWQRLPVGAAKRLGPLIIAKLS